MNFLNLGYERSSLSFVCFVILKIITDAGVMAILCPFLARRLGRTLLSAAFDFDFWGGSRELNHLPAHVLLRSSSPSQRRRTRVFGPIRTGNTVPPLVPGLFTGCCDRLVA